MQNVNDKNDTKVRSYVWGFQLRPSSYSETKSCVEMIKQLSLAENAAKRKRVNLCVDGYLS